MPLRVRRTVERVPTVDDDDVKLLLLNNDLRLPVTLFNVELGSESRDEAFAEAVVAVLFFFLGLPTEAARLVAGGGAFLDVSFSLDTSG